MTDSDKDELFNSVAHELEEVFDCEIAFQRIYDKGFKDGYEQRMADELREKDTTNNEEHF